MKKNFVSYQTRGKNGLWSHNSLRYTHTDDTYDLTDDVNFW